MVSAARFAITASSEAAVSSRIGAGAAPTLTTSNPTANGAVRTWNTVDAFITEVASSRIYAGVHYRTSTEVGAAMGRQIGALAAAKCLNR